MSPLAQLMAYCLDKAGTELFSGRKNIEESINYGLELIDKYINDKDFQEFVKSYYNISDDEEELF